MLCRRQRNNGCLEASLLSALISHALLSIEVHQLLFDTIMKYTCTHKETDLSVAAEQHITPTLM